MAFEYTGEIIGKISRDFILEVKYGDVLDPSFPSNMKTISLHKLPESTLTKEFQIDNWAVNILQHYKNLHASNIADGAIGNTYSYSDLT